MKSHLYQEKGFPKHSLENSFSTRQRGFPAQFFEINKTVIRTETLRCIFM